MVNSRIREEKDVVTVTLSGSLSFENVLPVMKQACDAAFQNSISKILMIIENSTRLPTTLERYELGSELAAYICERQPHLRLAIVGPEEIVDGFGALVAQNRGLFAQVFRSEADALTWLSA